jgi:hypothetical protein
VTVTDDGLQVWWARLDDAERQHFLDVWQGRPFSTETKALLDRVPVPGLVRVRGSFGGRDFEEYMPDRLREFIRARRVAVGWQPNG